ncbi:MAG: pyridoxal phosphate-dependent aminotransferase [Spirochaetes bacterium]|nr:pyridoxal phosphate-dependent aminotransferase [Spirochaetota bacterium]MBU1081504.1 pyridoxal phosphate-dependent aminotransferase [Spirochaetota bacterium]
MPIANAMRAGLERGSWIRKMFEAGIELKARLGPQAVFDFSLGNPDLEPPPEFLDALRAAAISDEPGSHAYMTNSGYGFARQAMAQKVAAEHDVPTQADDVVMTVGAAGALNVILRTVLNPGDEVVVVRPYFAEYSAYVENSGGALVVADSAPDFSLDPEAVARALSPRTAVVIINSPNNPTGRVYPRSDIEALASALSAHALKTGRAPYLVVDEPYRDIVYDGVFVPPVLSAYPESLVASSFSKTLSIPGERLGYVAVNPACAEKALLVSGLATSNRVLGFVNAPALMQRAVAASWRAKADVSRYGRRRDMLAAILDGAGIRYARPEGAFYLFCEVPAGGPATVPGESRDVAFAMALKDRGVLSVPGVGFGYPGWFRLCYCVPEATIEGSRAAFEETARAWNA